MPKETRFHILKKINIIKGYILISEMNENTITELIDELFKDEYFEEIIETKEELTRGNRIEALNIINELKDSISRGLFEKPCTKQWHDLVDSEEYSTKFCTDCKKNVYLVRTEEEFIKRKNLEQCVAVNSAEFNVSEGKDKNYKACHIKFKEFYFLGAPLSNE